VNIIKDIIELRKIGCKLIDIANSYKINRSYLSRIIKRQVRRDI